MKIEDAIQQKKFADAHHRAMVNLHYTSNWLSYMESSVLRRHGITMPQFNVLRILRGQWPNAATVNLLIERMIDKSSNASRIVEKLRGKGLIERQECKEDRRRVDVKITEKGLTLLESASADVKAFYQEHRSLSDDEAVMLSDLLDKVRCDKEFKLINTPKNQKQELP